MGIKYFNFLLVAKRCQISNRFAKVVKGWAKVVKTNKWIFRMKKLVSLLTRVFDGEAPYLQSFIDHHRKIGINKFYFLADADASSLCKLILKKNNIIPFEYRNKGPESSLKAPDLDIESEYVAVIDADEYIEPSVVDFIDSNDIQSISMPWKLFANFDFNQLEKIHQKSLIYPRGKEIVKVEDVAIIKSHTSEMKRPGRRLPMVEALEYTLNHYYMRGVEDLLYKGTGHHRRSSSFKNINKGIKFQMPSKRLLATAFIIRLINLQESKIVQPYCARDTDYEFLLNVKNGFDNKHSERMRREVIKVASKFNEDHLRAYLDIVKTCLNPKEGLHLQADATNFFKLSCSFGV